MARWITEQVAISGAAITAERWPELVEELGISAVVNLRAEYQDVFAAPFPKAYLWLPVIDHTDPTVEQMLSGAQFIDAAVRSGQRVLVHCKMGIGRSPTLAAAYLVWRGATVQEAVERVQADKGLLGIGPVVSRVALREFAAFLENNRAGAR